MENKRTFTLSLIAFLVLSFLSGYFAGNGLGKSLIIFKSREHKNKDFNQAIMQKRMQAISNARQNNQTGYEFSVATPPHLR